ncbi:acyl-CoA reductase [Halobacillus seohaensis]|uniref:Acyl-CoA reductase n=1 Tax=Halobacillus seohaensis TaxID=447421 RepID=A0ABW2EFT7_9BACI
MKEVTGYLPSMYREEVEYNILTFKGNNQTLDIYVPLLSNEQFTHMAEHVKQASVKVLKKRTVTQIVEKIDDVIGKLLDRNNPYRKKAEAFLPIITGYDKEMIRLGLTSYLKNFRKQELQRFLVEDFGNPLLLDDFQPRPKKSYSKAVGPNLTTHIWAGNVPALPLWSLISGLLVKSGNIGKVSSSEPLFATLFAQVLAEVDPELADCLAIVWWKGGDQEREENIFQQSDVVVGYGGNESLDALKTRVPLTTRLLPFGHKISFGIVSEAGLDGRKTWKIAHDAAYDVIRYDQQGCYSPHVFYVQRGGRVSPKDFAYFLAHELENFRRRYPRRTLEIEEVSMLASWRQKEEFQSFSDKEKEVIAEPSGSWTVVYEENNLQLTPSSLNRSVKVQAFDYFEELIPYLAPHRSLLQTVGVAVTPKELFNLGSLLGNIGVNRLTAIGAMTSPEAGWHHDGRFNLADLVEMVDIEQTAEEGAEHFAPYMD